MNSRIAVFCLFLWVACDSDPLDPAIPLADFNDILIDLNNVQFLNLKIDGGHVEIDGGVRGIILYRQNQSTFLAYEKNCSFQPLDSCATVQVDNSQLFLTDPCCGSNFDFINGQPLRGPATLPLRQYRTVLNGNRLTITSIPL